MAHFAEFSRGVTDYRKRSITSKSFVAGDEAVVVLWGGGPPPGNEPLTVDTLPASLAAMVELPPIDTINRKFRIVAVSSGTGFVRGSSRTLPFALLNLTIATGPPVPPKVVAADLEYDGVTLTWAARRRTYKASSGLPAGSASEPDWRESKYACVKDHGPIPEGNYSLSTVVDPDVFADVNKDPASCRVFPGSQIQQIPRGPAAGACEPYWANWGTNRVALKPNDSATSLACSPVRNGFYLHDSTKGFSHGCVEVETTFFTDLYDFAKKSGGKRLTLRVRYQQASTQGGTKIP